LRAEFLATSFIYRQALLNGYSSRHADFLAKAMMRISPLAPLKGCSTSRTHLLASTATPNGGSSSASTAERISFEIACWPPAYLLEEQRHVPVGATSRKGVLCMLKRSGGVSGAIERIAAEAVNAESKNCPNPIASRCESIFCSYSNRENPRLCRGSAGGYLLALPLPRLE
jgi:hypothetical protein